jgi:hypothetical protein
MDTRRELEETRLRKREREREVRERRGERGGEKKKKKRRRDRDFLRSTHTHPGVRPMECEVGLNRICGAFCRRHDSSFSPKREKEKV